ncbi:hypothetical protein l11_06890 [Neisseria weaveri LMG 5135]|nr:hypothetical protein l13_05160 [Neisseria weaveri ATCC 51223]EGV38117.1 hypothetical protein l11_06890 [Neisseria weaveri LMG 5135]
MCIWRIHTNAFFIMEEGVRLSQIVKKCESMLVGLWRFDFLFELFFNKN